MRGIRESIRLETRLNCRQASDDRTLSRTPRFIYPHDVAVAPFVVYLFGLDVFPRTMASLKIATDRWKTVTWRSVGNQCILISLTPGGKNTDAQSSLLLFA